MPAPVRDAAGEARAAAQDAGLRYVDDTMPGILRRRAGPRGFVYLDDGVRVRHAATLARIRSLGLPPAYESVWICRDPRGHLQATGIDQRGRKQYRYHDAWVALRERDKYARLHAFGMALPRLRAHVARDLRGHPLARDTVLAAVVYLLDQTLVRVGNRRYAHQNRSYGITTLQRRHMKLHGSRLRMQFTGKSGVQHDVVLSDTRLARIVRSCVELPGQQLFKYRDADGITHEVGSTDVNAYLQAVMGSDFTAKDFRTWSGSVLALGCLRKLPGPLAQDREAARAITAAIREVARQLRNTVAVCRKCYVHPAVLAAYTGGTLVACVLHRRSGLRQDERRLLTLLQDWHASCENNTGN